jgi:hypothetical protein
MHESHVEFCLLRTYQPDSHCMLKNQACPRICRTNNHYGKSRMKQHQLQGSTCLRRNTDLDQYKDTSCFGSGAALAALCCNGHAGMLHTLLFTHFGENKLNQYREMDKSVKWHAASCRLSHWA